MKKMFSLLSRRVSCLVAVMFLMVSTTSFSQPKATSKAAGGGEGSLYIEPAIGYPFTGLKIYAHQYRLKFDVFYRWPMGLNLGVGVQGLYVNYFDPFGQQITILYGDLGYSFKSKKDDKLKCTLDYILGGGTMDVTTECNPFVHGPRIKISYDFSDTFGMSVSGQDLFIRHPYVWGYDEWGYPVTAYLTTSQIVGWIGASIAF